jgi:hemerythrin-like domain-containing protein
MASTGDSVIDLLKSDHRRIEARLTAMETASHPDERRRLANLLIIEAVRHGVVEEMYLHPMAEKSLPHGADRIEAEANEHAKIEKKFDELEETDAASRQFQALVTALRTEVHEHVLDEEHSLFVWVQQCTDLSARIEVGKRLKAFLERTPGFARGPGLTRRVREALGGRRYR